MIFCHPTLAAFMRVPRPRRRIEHECLPVTQRRRFAATAPDLPAFHRGLAALCPRRLATISRPARPSKQHAVVDAWIELAIRRQHVADQRAGRTDRRQGFLRPPARRRTSACAASSSNGRPATRNGTYEIVTQWTRGGSSSMTGRARAEREQRIGRGPYRPSAPVWTTWDLDGASATPPQSGSPMRSAARSESSIMTRRRVSASGTARARSFRGPMSGPDTSWRDVLRSPPLPKRSAIWR